MAQAAKKDGAPRVLLVAKRVGESYSLVQFLDQWRCDFQIAHSMVEARKYLENESFDLVLSELQLNDGHARDLVGLLKDSHCSMYLSIGILLAC